MMNKRWVRFVLASLLIMVLSFGLEGSAFASGNSNQGSKPLEKARQVLEEKLIGLPGIAGIAHSEETGEIIVFLENERAKGQVPGRFEGFPIRMEITGKFQAHSVGVADPIAPSQVSAVSDSRLTEVSPLVGGVSVSALAGELYIYAGTLGMVTYDNKILSNAHVIAMNTDNNDFLPSGTPIIQPGSLEGGTLTDKVGELERYIPLNFKGRSRNYADAAIASIDAGIEGLAGEQFGESGNYQVSGTTTVAAGDTVRKSGRTSGVTESTVYLANASVTVDYGLGNRAYFVDQIIVDQFFSEGGDSGSMVDKGGKFVGLVFAGSADYSIVCKASYIIEGLGISVEPIAPPPDPPSLTSIEVEPETASIVIGSTQQFTATGIYSDGSTADLTESVTWESSNETVATITIALGLATGVYEGTATITASLDTLSDTAELTVTAAPSQPTVNVNISMDTDSRPAGRKNVFGWAIATVSVKNVIDGVVVDGATVEGRWVDPANSAVSGTTDASGNVSLQSNSVKNPSSGTTFTFVVDRVTKGDIIYDFTADSELTDSIVW
jgi:hypothetical protein